MAENQLVPRNATTELAPIQYPLLVNESEMQGITAAIKENIGPRGLSDLDLVRIKVPSGAALSWVVPTLDGDQSMKEIEGIIVAWRDIRLYWKKALNEGGGKSRPDCRSSDSIVGIGDPGGDCYSCPLAQFGSAPRGTGQACKQVRQMLVVRAEQVLPDLIPVPPTSIQNSKDYLLKLTAARLPYWGVITRFRLERTTNEAGIAYAKITFSLGRKLEEREKQLLRPYHEMMASLIEPLEVDNSDYRSEPVRPYARAAEQPEESEPSKETSLDEEEVPY